VAMDRGHLEELRRLYPGARDRIVLLRSWDSEVPEGEDADVDDPWSHPERAYVSMFGVLERSVEGLLRARGRLGR
jgi:protein-tyrosine-phosphatase